MLIQILMVLSLVSPIQDNKFFDDGTNFVYREAQSCAWYADFSDGAMIRLSYRAYSREVFFSVVGGPWDGAQVGQTYTTRLRSGRDMRVGHAFNSRGIIQPGDDVRRGLAGQQGEELIALFRSAPSIAVDAGQIAANYPLQNMEVAMDKLMSCGMAYFSEGPQ